MRLTAMLRRSTEGSAVAHQDTSSSCHVLCANLGSGHTGAVNKSTAGVNQWIPPLEESLQRTFTGTCTNIHVQKNDSQSPQRGWFPSASCRNSWASPGSSVQASRCHNQPYSRSPGESRRVWVSSPTSAWGQRVDLLVWRRKENEARNQVRKEVGFPPQKA